MNDDNKKLNPSEIAKAASVNYEKGFLTLPFEQEQFKDFIISLLGKPQTISKKIYGTFDITMQDIQNFHYLLEQRLEQQNKALLIQFESRIYFSDNSFVTLNSFQDLVSYREVKPVISVAIDLSWEYLIQFNDKKHPEKQGIDISIWTGEANEVEENRTYNELLDLGEGYRGDNSFKFTIRHTARTWGMDIEALLTSHIKSLMITEGKVKRLISENNFKIGSVSGILFFLGAAIGATKAVKIYSQSYIKEVDAILSSTAELSKKIDVLAHYIFIGDINRFSFLSYGFYFIAFLVSIFVASFIGNLAENRCASFLVLTQSASKYREKKLQESKLRWIGFLVSIGISIIVNVLASYIFSYLIQIRSEL